jgi:hypothetical protein
MIKIHYECDAFGKSHLSYKGRPCTADDPHTIFTNWTRGEGGRGAEPPELQRKTMLLCLSSRRVDGMVEAGAEAAIA